MLNLVRVAKDGLFVAKDNINDILVYLHDKECKIMEHIDHERKGVTEPEDTIERRLRIIEEKLVGTKKN